MVLRPFLKSLGAVLALISFFTVTEVLAAAPLPAVPLDRVVEDRIIEIMNHGYLYKPFDEAACRSVIKEVLAHPDESLTTEDEYKNRQVLYATCFDEHSSIFSPRVAKAMETRTKGHFSGIGVTIELDKATNMVVVATIYQGSPAERSGVRSGDKIISVRQDGSSNDEPVLTTEDAVSKITGPQGTKVFITIDRGGLRKVIEIIRGEVKIPSVYWKVIPGTDIGYIQVLQFGEQTPDDFEDALKKFKRSDGTNPTVIVDLRNNPGGLLNAALEMLSYFSSRPNDQMLTIRGGDGSQNIDTVGSTMGWFSDPATRKIKSPGLYEKYRVIILINKGSASASEIFSGTMKDWSSTHNFIVVGDNSYGKGVGQGIFHLPNEGALRMTSFEFLVGNSKTKIHKVGVVPDYIESDTRRVIDDTMTEKDKQFTTALVLAKYHQWKH